MRYFIASRTTSAFFCTALRNLADVCFGVGLVFFLVVGLMCHLLL